jgi:hypothetical protein
MSYTSSKISFEEAERLINGALLEEEITTSVDSALSYSDRFTIAPPSCDELSLFVENANDLYSSACDVRSSLPILSRYDLNWCSVEDYVANWNLLDRESQTTLRLLTRSDNKNANRFGLKKRNLESHLLLNIGCDMNNIVNNGKDSVRTNLKSSSPDAPNYGYSRDCLSNRTVDPKTCLRAYKKFDKEFSAETLFKKGLVAYQAVITSDSSLRDLSSDPMNYKIKVHEFFKTNTEYLAKLCNKRRKIFSYVYSHEISVDSILDQKYRPHTHVIFFVKKDSFYRTGEASESQKLVKELEEKINKEFSDRKWSCERVSIDNTEFPKVARKYSEIERSFEYLHRAYSLSAQYMREIREDNVRELNKATVETYRSLIWLYAGEPYNPDCRAIRRLRACYVPKRSVGDKYKHPLLSKEKKRNTIRKATVEKVSKTCESRRTQDNAITEQSPQTSPGRPDGPGRLSEGSRDSRTGQGLHDGGSRRAFEACKENHRGRGHSARAHERPQESHRLGSKPEGCYQADERGAGCEAPERGPGARSPSPRACKSSTSAASDVSKREAHSRKHSTRSGKILSRKHSRSSQRAAVSSKSGCKSEKRLAANGV